jgi:hypothetical protein
MKKILAIAMTVVMLCCLCAGAFASEINSYEQKLIDYCNKEYQTKENGVYIKLPADYAAKANTYLMMVDITDDQFAVAEMQIKALENLIRTELSVSADAQTLKLEEVSDDFYNKVLAIFKNLAAAIDASVVISSDFDRTNPNTTGSVVLRSNSDSSALVYIFGQPSPAAGINVPVIVACSALAVAAIIAVAFFVARKRTVRG